MPVSGFLLYKLPPGAIPGAADIDALERAIDKLCPVPTVRRGALSIAATMTGLKQAAVRADGDL